MYKVIRVDKNGKRKEPKKADAAELRFEVKEQAIWFVDGMNFAVRNISGKYKYMAVDENEPLKEEKPEMKPEKKKADDEKVADKKASTAKVKLAYPKPKDKKGGK